MTVGVQDHVINIQLKEKKFAFIVKEMSIQELQNMQVGGEISSYNDPSCINFKGV